MGAQHHDGSAARATGRPRFADDPRAACLRLPGHILRKIRAEGACWIWSGAQSEGYGHIKQAGRTRRASRVVYELLVGPIPEGHELDHVKDHGCTSTLCVKAIADEYGPAHLEPVTHRENVLRGQGPTAMHARQTHCKNGHPLTPENVRLEGTGRRCIICKTEYSRAWRRRKRGAA